MKKVLFTLIAILASFAYSFSQHHDFEAVCETGQTLYYKITDEEARTVMLIAPAKEWKGFGKPAGEIILPSHVSYQGKEYSVTAIGDEAFQNCSQLTGSLSIPNTVVSIGFCAFSNCTGFNGTLTLGNDLKSIYSHAFSSCSGFTGSLCFGNNVEWISDAAFMSCSGFTGSLCFGDSLLTIGSLAFFDCSGFDGSLTIPEQVTHIGMDAFHSCNGFRTLNYNAINCNTEYVFSNTNFTTLNIGPNVEVISDYAFYKLSSVTHQLVIPESVIIIGIAAFERCGFTGELVIPESVREIGAGAFSGCSGITGTLHIPNSVSYIDNHAFQGCSGLSGLLTFPSSTHGIGDEVFKNCTGIDSLFIPATLTSIGTNAFAGCNKLESIKVETTNPNYYSANTNALIDWHTNELLLGCKNTVISSDISEIGSYAFYNCVGMEGELKLSPATRTIKKYAFSGCTHISKIICEAETPPTLGEHVFDNVPQTIPLVVPCDSYDAYFYADGWSSFSDIENPYSFNIQVVSSNQDYGTAELTQAPSCDNFGQAIVKASAQPGYDFIYWSENGVQVSTDSIYSFTATNDAILIANFEYNDIDENTSNVFSIYPNPAHKSIIVNSLSSVKEYKIFNASGQILMTGFFNDNQSSIDISNLSAGIYFLKIEEKTARFVIE